MVKGECLDALNDLRKAAYLARKSDRLAADAGKTAADYEAEFGAFQDLRANDGLRISHKKAETSLFVMLYPLKTVS